MKFLPAFLVHWRVVGALLLREMHTRFGKNKLGYLWAFIEPTLHILTFTLIFYVMGRSHIANMPIATFFMTGIVTWFLFLNTYTKVLVAIASNTNLLAYPQVSTYDIIVSRIVLEYATSMGVFVIMSIVLSLIGVEISTGLVIMIPTTMVFVTLLGAGIGMIVCAVKYYFESVDKIVAVLFRLIYFASGIFYLVSALPGNARQYLMLNPMVHAIDLIRIGFFSIYPRTEANTMYLAQVTFACLFCGLLADRVTRSKVGST